MKKRLSMLLLALLLACGHALAQEDILYTGTVSKTMTIREKQSTSARKLGSVEEGGLINIIEYGKDWTLVDQDGVRGYVLSKNVEDLAAAEGYNDEADAQYLGTAEIDLTIRASKDKSSQKMQMLTKDEKVYITELGEEWHAVVKQGVHGYVLADRVKNLHGAHEGIEVPEEFKPAPPFKAVYSARADVNLSIRKEEDADSKLIGTVYEDEYVDVMEINGEWAHVKKDDAEGYVRADHLRYYKRYDPYGPYIPGVKFYPYAAQVVEEVEITDSETGELLRTVPKGAVMAVSAPSEDMSVTLPYDRITGRITETAKLEFEGVTPWDEAQMGDLVAVFSTYYDPAQDSQEQKGRLHNIMQGVERLNNVIIPTREKFYFNDYCAPYTKGNGYELGPIVNYVSSQKLGYGGGICQVSTTLYDAILQIPIGVIKQQVHSAYGISYAPLDMDAAVGAGNIDLRLENTLPYDIRLALQAVGGVLTVRVYRAN